MSFMGFFPNEQERRLAREEAAYALEKHGDRAAEALADKAAQSRKHRTIYKLARAIVLEG